MEDIIRVLPDSVANQIAAGEVVQRPASVVKELMENAIDAGATRIDVRLKEAGRSLIQVTDNGKGMSPSDARMAFQRHATSKLRLADDLFHLKTMGFRGEALASIAAVAYVEVVTRRPSDELATKIELEGSAVTNEEPTLAAQGSRFTVRNLFYNIPARRKFLGDNVKELKFIREEFIQIALVYPELTLSLTHNDDVLYQLNPGPLRQRILTIFGKRSAGQLNKQLYPVDVKTQLVNITGFVGDPAAACQRDPLQYFFVNSRFIRHKYFRNAVLKAYETLLPAGMQPVYFLYFEVASEALDVNIHPTKTEVKFEHEQAIWPIIHALVREALGKFNAVPSIDFDREDAPEIGVFTGDRLVSPPKVSYNPSYNPFLQKNNSHQTDWELLFQDFHKGKSHAKSDETSSGNSLKERAAIFESGKNIVDSATEKAFADSPSLLFGQNDAQVIPCSIDLEAPKIQLFGSYIALNCRHALLLIHQQRAHVRILYERYLKQMELRKAPSQTLLFPESLLLDSARKMEFSALEMALQSLGFQFDESIDRIDITAIPVDIHGLSPNQLVLDLMDSVDETGSGLPDGRTERLALKMAKAAAIPCNRFLSAEEMEDLILRLTETDEPKYTPDGKPVFSWITPEEVLKRF